MAWACTLLAVLLIGLVALLQQTSESAAVRAAGDPLEQAAADIAPPDVQLEITAKVYTRIAYATGQRAQFAPDTMRALESTIQGGPPEDRLRVATVAAALDDEEKALQLLDQVETEAPSESPLAEDAATLRAIYTGEEIPDTAGLVERHGWFGRLAATQGLAPEDPARQAVVGGGWAIIMFFSLLALGAMGAVIAGLVLLIVGIVKAVNGELQRRFVPPSPGGSVMIETVAVFIAGFVALKVATGVVAAFAGESDALGVALGAQWLLIGTLFWPVARGVPAGRTLELLGLHKGTGVLREIGWGIVGYLACLPLLVAGAITSVVLMFVYQTLRAMSGEPPEQVSNPMLEMFGPGQSRWTIVALFLLASLWAPLVEEAVFRGALYRYLRSWWHWAAAAVVTALAFGLMHGYPILLLGPVIALGFGFALIREWRGSLIPSMTAHCIHNAGVMTVLLTTFSLLGD